MTGAERSGGASNSYERTDFRREEDAVLQAVLDSTSRASEETVKPEILEALKDVARRHAGDEPCSPEAMTELIGVFVSDMIQSLPVRFTERWTRNLTDDVVAAMASDQGASQRIERFWSRLKKAVA